jgi:sec-independent protein translocase protein TatA
MFRNPTTDLIVVLVIVLLIFGPKRLPGLGKQLGTGLREFKESITGEDKHDEEAEDAAARPEITAASNASTPAGPAGAAPAERESAEVGPQSRS